MRLLRCLSKDVSALVNDLEIVAAEPEDVGACNVGNELAVSSVIHVTTSVRIIVDDGLLWQALDDVVVVREQADEVTDLDNVVGTKTRWEGDQVGLELTVEHVASVVLFINEGHSSDCLYFIALDDMTDITLVLVEEMDKHITYLIFTDNGTKLNIGIHSAQCHGSV